MQSVSTSWEHTGLDGPECTVQSDMRMRRTDGDQIAAIIWRTGIGESSDVPYGRELQHMPEKEQKQRTAPGLQERWKTDVLQQIHLGSEDSGQEVRQGEVFRSQRQLIFLAISICCIFWNKTHKPKINGYGIILGMNENNRAKNLILFYYITRLWLVWLLG